MSDRSPGRGRRWGRGAALGLALLGLSAAAGWFAVVRPARARDREARAAVARARDDLRNGRPGRALREVARVSEGGPWAAEVLTVKGLALAALDRPEAARPLLERALAIDPNQAMAAKVLAAVYFSASDPGRGFQMLERAARADPDDFRPWFAAGDITLRFRDRPADAVRPFKEALRRRPDHADSRVGLIDALLASGGREDVAPLLDAALRDLPDDPRVLTLAARHARLSGRLPESVRFAERALAIDPDNKEALFLRAHAFELTGRPREALGLAERAAAVAPNDPAALNLLARVESSLGLKERSAATSARHHKALGLADRVRQLTAEAEKRPDDPEPRWRLGQAAAEAGMTPLAVRSFRAALALDPSCQPARRGLAALNPPPAAGLPP